MVVNAGGNGAPEVFRMNSAGWRSWGHKMRAKETTIAFTKSEKTLFFRQNMNFLAIWRFFWMTSA